MSPHAIRLREAVGDLHITRSADHRAMCDYTEIGSDRGSDFGALGGRPDGRLCRDCLDAVLDREAARMAATAAQDYDSYIQSDHWKHVRRLALEHYGATCVLCNATRHLNVHHRTYDNLGGERLADLIVLCRTCHARHHDK